MPKRFLIIKPSSLGDIIHAFPAISLLKKYNPDSHIDWFVMPAFGAVAAYHPDVNRNIHFQRSEMNTPKGFTRNFPRLVKGLRKEKYDAVIDLQGLLRSAAISKMVRTRTVAGPRKPREAAAAVFYKRKLAQGNHPHAVMKNLAMMADFLGVAIPEKIEFDMPVDKSISEKILAEVGTREFYVVAPGARWKTKEWPPEYFAGIIEEMRKRHPHLMPVIAGSKSEIPQTKEIVERMRSNTRFIDLTGKTNLRELVELIRSAKILFCNDSGPMHIASAVGTPLVAVFGPTAPELTGPFTEKATVLTPDLPCLKCFKRTCKKCLCHKSLRPSMAADAADALMR